MSHLKSRIQPGGRLAALALSLVALLSPATLIAQAPAAPAAATVSAHGKVVNPAGSPLTTGEIKFSATVAGTPASDPKDLKYQYTFPIDKSGTYTGTGLKPGDYIVVVFSDGKYPDFQKVTLKPGDNTVDFDMTREEYLKAMSPEDRKALEEFKKKNAAVTADNAKIQNINAVLKAAIEQEHNGQADQAVTALQGIVPLRPDEPIIWGSLGQAQLAAADQAAKAAGKSAATDPAIMQKYADTAASYQKALDLANAAAKKPTPEVFGGYYQNLGTALLKSGKLTEAAAAYDNAAKAYPAIAGTVYYNEAANLFNMNHPDEAAAAADKAIAADPKRPDSYYIKAQGLVQHATVDEKTKKIVLPPGCLEAYQEYLELAPDGAHAAEVKELLTGLGQPIKNSFKATKPH
jgi:tetratricopeptide (TPR) repeat protein